MSLKFTVSVLGASQVGKSAVVTQYVHGSFSDEYAATVENSFTKQIELHGKHVTLEITDTAGGDMLNEMKDLYAQKSDGFVLMYSITTESTFRDIPYLVENILRAKGVPKVPMVLVGNKCDLESERKVSTDSGQHLAAQYKNCAFVETSAKLQINVAEVFELLTLKMAKQQAKKGNCSIS